MSDTTATLALFRRGDQILLAMKKQGFGAGYWNGPGGKLEPGESQEQCMIRECQEEIGVTPRSYHKVAEHDFVLDSISNPWHMYGHVYVCNAWDGEPTESIEMRPQWFDIADIPYDQMWQDDVYWLPQVLAGKLLRTSFTFDSENNMLTHDVQEVEVL